MRAKLQRPLLPEDLIPRRRLLERLHADSSQKITLISAQAGAGKTTLLVQWLEQCAQPSAWLSLDEGDNDPIVFMTYLCATIQSVFPGACGETLDLLASLTPPPPRTLVASLVNDLDRSLAEPAPRGSGSADSSERGFVLALDDYHVITKPAIHEIVAGLLQHLPQGAHLALATRTDPPLPLARLRARREMTEVRSIDLRFTLEEAQTFLDLTTGRKLNAETLDLVQAKTEGWVVGLRLAALSMRYSLDGGSFVQRFKGTSSPLIMEYFVEEVMARQPPEIQDFVLHTSLLDRFCAPLCGALTGLSATRSRELIEWMAQANLFLLPLDEGDGWYRYHHLFQDLWRHELRQRIGAAALSTLHARAAAWFAQNGSVDEALRHFLAADDTAAAVAVVVGQRAALMNAAQWPRLERYLHAFPPGVVEQSPELLMAKTWLVYECGQYAELPAAIEEIEAALARTSLVPEVIAGLGGEVHTLRALLSYAAADGESALAHAWQALAQTPQALWIARILARVYVAGGLLLTGQADNAYEIVYAGFEKEGDGSNAFKATLLTTACNLHWMAADLPGLALAAGRVLALSQEPHSPAFRAWGHYHLGRVAYQRGDLDEAEAHFAAVVRQPYLAYGPCYVNSACGLALAHQALGRPQQAREVVEAAAAFLLETGNTTLLPVALAFRAELALRQGRMAAAIQQVAMFEPVPPLTPMYGIFAPHLTLVKVWLAEDTPASRERAAELLGRVQVFCESSSNTRFLIETLALQALLHAGEGDEPAALAALQEAVRLAEPGGLIRLFVDLGPRLDRLLDRLRWQGVAVEYITQILIAFEAMAQEEGDEVDARSPADGPPPSLLVEPLTPREMDVLELLAQHLTNKEIAARLTISPGTVKTHTLNIYGKLGVGKRREAVTRAKDLNLI